MTLPELAPGQEYTSPPITLSMARMLAFSGGPIDAPDWPKRNLHTDVAKAAEAGFRAPIASSIQAEGHAVRLLESLFGEAWYSTGVIDLKLIQPLFAGDSFTLRVIVRNRTAGADGTHYELDVAGARVDGETIVVGTAQVTLR